MTRTETRFVVALRYKYDQRIMAWLDCSNRAIIRRSPMLKVRQGASVGKQRKRPRRWRWDKRSSCIFGAYRFETLKDAQTGLKSGCVTAKLSASQYYAEILETVIVSGPGFGKVIFQEAALRRGLHPLEELALEAE